MELHSYAKRRASKWTIEQKRKLVEARIINDKLFTSKPTTSLVPWKRILTIAKLDDYNVFFVRRQWSAMVSKYKQYKHNRLGDVATNNIDEETIQKISQEWEFFRPIHHFMVRKTQNLHSYALQERPGPGPSKLSTSQKGGPLMKFQTQSTNAKFTKHVNNVENYSSDESNYDNNNFGLIEISPKATQTVSVKTESHTQNTDHDFYSKKFEQAQQQQQRHHHQQQEQQKHQQLNNIHNQNNNDYVASLPMVKVENPDQEMISPSEAADAGVNVGTENVIIDGHVTPTSGLHSSTLKYSLNSQPTPAFITTESIPSIVASAQKPPFVSPSTSARKHQNPSNHNDSGKSVKTTKRKPREQLSERDKYYRHKRHFNRRIEKRLDGIMNVFGQIAKAEYPTLDINPLFIGMGTLMAATNVVNLNRFPSGNSSDSTSNSSSSSETAENNSRNKNGELVHDIPVVNGKAESKVANSNKQNNNNNHNGQEHSS